MMEQEANADVKLTRLVNRGLPQIVSFIAKTITSQAIRWSEGATELHLIDSPDLRLGSDLVDRKIVRDVYADMESKLKESAVYLDFEATRAEIKSLDRKLHEELVIIRLKRIVPGHCDLCPL
ncbi:MAG: hypothetical protein NTX46_00030 [Chloroflexi bacterium]|nr:hypothetical protein [Chloroflexota bacterium]